MPVRWSSFFNEGNSKWGLNRPQRQYEGYCIVSEYNRVHIFKFHNHYSWAVHLSMDNDKSSEWKLPVHKYSLSFGWGPPGLGPTLSTIMPGLFLRWELQCLRKAFCLLWDFSRLYKDLHGCHKYLRWHHVNRLHQLFWNPQFKLRSWSLIRF